jgi:hypothetical protein
MGRGSFGALVAGLVMTLAAGFGQQALSSSQSQDTDVTKKPELRATPLTPTETLQAPPQSAAQPMPTNRVQRRVTQQAMDDLAQRLTLPVERIEFLEFRSMLWPDGGLGCPRPGMVYPQVQQEGYLIRLRAGKREFDYHGGSRRGPYLCEKKSG